MIVFSAVLTAVGGVAYAQYIAYVNPETLSGIGVSLRVVFGLKFIYGSLARLFARRSAGAGA